MAERQEYDSSAIIAVRKCSNRVKLFVTFDKEGNVITNEGKNGDLYVVPDGNCLMGSTVHFKARSSGVKCMMDCPAIIRSKPHRI